MQFLQTPLASSPAETVRQPMSVGEIKELIENIDRDLLETRAFITQLQAERAEREATGA